MHSMKHSVEVIARGVCVVRGQVLLCHGKGADNTYLPGGHVEFREPARLALEREIREELGRASRAGRFLGCAEHVFRHKGRWHAEINLVFALRIPGLSPTRAPAAREPWIEFQWCPLRRLKAARLEPAAMARRLPSWLRRPGGWATTKRNWATPTRH